MISTRRHRLWLLLLPYVGLLWVPIYNFREPELFISIGGVQIAGISPHYSAVREGKPVALWNSWGRLEIAIRNGSAVRHLRTRNGDRVQVKFRR